MLIFRYLAKEVLTTLMALTVILLLIFMSNQFVQYINRVASGQIPLFIILKLMMLEIPKLTCLLLPLGFYIALLIAYGRLYVDSEMAVLQASGYGTTQLLKHSFVLAAFVSMLVLITMLWVNPAIDTARAKLLRTSGVKTLIQTLMPGRFQAFSSGDVVFYVASVNRNHSKAQDIFLARQIHKNPTPQWEVLWAKEAYIATDKITQQDVFILANGQVYQGLPGKANYQLTNFGQYQARIPTPTVDIKEDVRTLPTSSLFFLRGDKNKAAELQWRLAIPLMVLTLTLVAVPLSRVKPRSGKFAKLLPAIIIYIIYANFIFIGRNWMLNGTTPLWMGLWWLHLCIALLGVGLLWSNKRAFA